MRIAFSNSFCFALSWLKNDSTNSLVSLGIILGWLELEGYVVCGTKREDIVCGSVGEVVVCSASGKFIDCDTGGEVVDGGAGGEVIVRDRKGEVAAVCRRKIEAVADCDACEEDVV